MQKLKMILLVPALFFAGSTIAQQQVQSNQPQSPAQYNQGSNGSQLTPQQKAQRTTTHLQKKLQLSPNQATEVYNLTLAHEQAKINYDNDIYHLLTSVQQGTWLQMKAKQEAKRQGNKQKGGNNQGNGNPSNNPNGGNGGNY